MELLTRFVGIWMVFVIYIAVGVEGVALNAVCTSGGTACADSNAECRDDGSGLQCLCLSTFFEKADGTCGSQVALNAVCLAGESGSQCADTNAECKDVSGLKCLCKDNFFEKSDVTCVAQVALNAVCLTGESISQCADTNAECKDASGLKCLCKDAYYEKADGTCVAQIALDVTCLTGQSADQCADSLAECRDDSGLKCKCKAANYDNSGACAARKYPEVACSGDQCVEHATCNTTCKCDAGYTATPSTTPTTCSGVVKFATLPYMYVVPILVSMMFLLR